MGKSNFGAVSGTLNNGGSFSTPYSLQQVQSSAAAIKAAALTLQAAVSAALVKSTGSATGTIGAGWMRNGDVTTLSASYSATSGTLK